MGLVSVLFDILQRPSIGGVLGELLVLMAPLCIAVCIGVLVGWTWKPRWANLSWESSDFSVSEITSSASLAMASGQDSIPSLNSLKFQLPSCISPTANQDVEPVAINPDCSSSQHTEVEKSTLVGVDDLEHICRLVEEKDGGPAWIKMMDRSTANLTYQAWRRDPQTGPPQYRSRTVFEDATPELVRDFFWDDEFRLKWEDMLLSASILEECPTTGTLVVHWVRKFPFFCSNREYVIGRRIWESGRSYYCVTKGVPYPALPSRDKPRRVDLYYSSWCIRAVESMRGDGQMTSCEVLLFHHEEMGIPWEIAKLGVRQGMWGAVKKIEPGLRAYQKERSSGSPLSRCAVMAQINTRVKADYLKSLESETGESAEVETRGSHAKQVGSNLPKLLVIGGAVVLACSIDQGLLTKAVIFGVARRFANIGKRLQ